MGNVLISPDRRRGLAVSRRVILFAFLWSFLFFWGLGGVHLYAKPHPVVSRYILVGHLSVNGHIFGAGLDAPQSFSRNNDRHVFGTCLKIFRGLVVIWDEFSRSKNIGRARLVT